MSTRYRQYGCTQRQNGLLGVSRKAILAGLAAALALAPLNGFTAESAPVRIEKASGRITIVWDGQMLARYQSAPNPNKPYLESLFSPAGLNVLRDSPADHKHHHGLMFAVAVDGVDFWSETPQCGRQQDGGVTASVRPGQGDRPARKATPAALLTQRLTWTSADGKPLLDETRTLEFTRLAGGPATLVLWQTRLGLPSGRPASVLSGSPYFGLGMRFVASMDQGGQLFNSLGGTGQAGTNNARAPWTAYSAAVDGKPVTVAMFDLPGNPRAPAVWFTMQEPFAYLSATVGLHDKPLALRASEPLQLRYAVAVWDGKVSAAAISEFQTKVLAEWFR